MNSCLSITDKRGRFVDCKLCSVFESRETIKSRENHYAPPQGLEYICDKGA